MNREFAQRVTPSFFKFIDVVLFLLSYAARQNQKLTIGDICDLVYVADQSHLNERGIPIIFDEYFATRKGPVPKHLFNLLVAGRSPLDETVRDLWTRTISYEGTRYDVLSHPRRAHDPSSLCETEVALLSGTMDDLFRNRYKFMRGITQNKAYIDALNAQRDDEAVEIHINQMIDVDVGDDLTDFEEMSESWSRKAKGIAIA